MQETARRSLEEDGFVLLPGVFSTLEIGTIVRELSAALERSQEESEALRGHAGGICGARNVLALWPPAATVWQQPAMADILTTVLGPRYGLVRVLFFDKPPGQSWSLPWHKDLTIAVRDNRLPSEQFRRPTTKAGVPHVEAPLAVLERMLTARLHLDEVTDENGPLRVIPGSHRTGRLMDMDEARARHVWAKAGDVLLMRPLLAHGSGGCNPETTRHRRILHFEFGASRELPDGYAWHTFLGRSVLQ